MVIKANACKYSKSVLCRCPDIARSTCYYGYHDPKDEGDLEEAVQETYDKNRYRYGQRELKRVLYRKDWTISLRRVRRIMAKRGLILVYTCKKYHMYANKNNEIPVLIY